MAHRRRHGLPVLCHKSARYSKLDIVAGLEDEVIERIVVVMVPCFGLSGRHGGLSGGMSMVGGGYIDEKRIRQERE
jgi:hypothetical protein